MRGCVLFPLVAAGGANSGQVIDLYGRSIEGRRHLYLPGERRGVFNPQGAKNTEEVIITESVIDAAALWSAGLRNVIPVYGVTGLTEEIMAHLVECRVKRVVQMLDADDAGRAAALVRCSEDDDDSISRVRHNPRPLTSLTVVATTG